MATDRRVLKVRGLGTAVVSVGRLKILPESDRLFVLALALAQRAGERVSRAELRELVWPDAPEASGRHSLRQALYRLHQAGLRTEDRADDVRLDPADVDSDLARASREEWITEATPPELEAAVSILPNVVPKHEVARELVEGIRQQIGAQYRRAVLRRIAACKREARWRDVDHWALMLLQNDPLNEEATLARAEAVAMVGAKAEALEILDLHLDELGDRTRAIGLPAKVLRKRISEIEDLSKRRVVVTSLPFIGRHELLARVQDELAEAVGGTASALWLIGPAGIGKSRVMRELARIVKMSPHALSVAGVRPSFEDRPLAVITELLETLLTLPGALGVDPDALNILRQLSRTVTDAEPLPPEELRARQHAIYLCWLDLLDALLEERALVLLVDDAHWADAHSMRVLARTLESRPKARLMVILAARHVPRDSEGARVALSTAPQERVAPLTEPEMREYTGAAGLAAESEYEALTARLAAASGGNPLFLSHLIHQSRIGGPTAALPRDLASLIDGQLETLSEEATRLLQACSLLGRNSTLARLERSLGLSAQALVAPFAELDALLLLPAEVGAPLAPHDAWAERVRTSMRPGVLRTLSLSAARVVEADADVDNLVDLHWHAARLYRLSGERGQAYRVMMKIGAHLVESGALVEACEALSEAADLADTPQQSLAALSAYMRALVGVRDWQGASGAIDRIRALEIRLDSSLEDELNLNELSTLSRTHSNSSELARELLSISQRDEAKPMIRLEAALQALIVMDNAMDRDGVSRVFAASSGLAPETPAEMVRRKQLDLVAHTILGEPSLALAIADELELLASGQDASPDSYHLLFFASYPPRRFGDHATAKRRIEQMLQIGRKRRNPLAIADALDLLAGLHLDYGRLDECGNCFDELGVLGTATFDAPRLRSQSTTRALYLVESGRWQEAEVLVEDPASILARGHSRAQYMEVAATLRVSAASGNRERGIACLDALSEVREQLFRCSGSDVVAIAYIEGLNRFKSSDEATHFADWYLSTARHDKLPLPRIIATSATMAP